MDKDKIQNQILDMLEEIVQLSREVHPDCRFLSLVYLKQENTDGEFENYYHVNNDYWNYDDDFHIDLSRRIHEE